MPKNKRELTPRRRTLLKKLAEGKTITQAEKEAGYSTKHPGQSGYQALKEIAKSFPELLEKHGLTDDALIEDYLIPLLRAKRKKYFQHKGKVTDTRDEAALDIRKDALDMTFKLKGSYAPPAVEQKSKHVVSVIVLDVPRPPRENPPDTVIEIASESESSNAAPKHAQLPELERTSAEAKPLTNDDSKQ